MREQNTEVDHRHAEPIRVGRRHGLIIRLETLRDTEFNREVFPGEKEGRMRREDYAAKGGRRGQGGRRQIADPPATSGLLRCYLTL